jgi:CHASE3 domain sensor protein
LLLNTQKGYAVTKLKDYEEKNEELIKKYNDKIKENNELKENKKVNENEINDLKKK